MNSAVLLVVPGPKTPSDLVYKHLREFCYSRFLEGELNLAS